MKITYDKSVDAAYIYLIDEIRPSAVKRTYSCDPVEVNGEINLDFDADDRLIGIEILGASKRLPEAVIADLLGRKPV